MSYIQKQAYFKGKRAEEAFCKLTGAKPSSASEDRYDHIDCFLPNGDSVDVKAHRKSHANGYLLVEFKNVAGDAGWASKQSKAKWIAYELEKGFLCVDKDELRRLAEKRIFAQPSSSTKVWRDNNITPEAGLYKFIGRGAWKGKLRKDVFTYIRLEDAKEITYQWHKK